MTAAFRLALVVHKALGDPIRVLRSVAGVRIPPEEIEVSPEPVKGQSPFAAGR